ncbi:hypothetical protein VF14_35370 [Nostoc linckia z18]|nr:hypothetical protein VF14_35370 [Nostoc linckia z18]
MGYRDGGQRGRREPREAGRGRAGRVRTEERKGAIRQGLRPQHPRIGRRGSVGFRARFRTAAAAKKGG